MRNEPYVMLDPTAESAPAVRQRVAPPETLADATIGLLSITKERSDEFLDTVERRLAANYRTDGASDIGAERRQPDRNPERGQPIVRIQ